MFIIIVFCLITGVFSKSVWMYSQRIRVYDDHIFEAHLLPSFLFHPIRKDCIINRVKSKCLTSIGSGGSPLKGRKTKERTRSGVSGRTEWEGGESSCEFYASPIAGWNRLHRSAKSICADDASVNDRDIVSVFCTIYSAIIAIMFPLTWSSYKL